MNFPTTDDEWRALDNHFKANLLPSVMTASDAESKYSIMSNGIYNSLSQAFGKCYQRKQTCKHKKRGDKLSASLAGLRQQKKDCRKEHRDAMRSGHDPKRVQSLSRQWFKLIREHNRVRKLKLLNEQQRRSIDEKTCCDKNFWQFVSSVFHPKPQTTDSSLDMNDTSSYFKRCYSSLPHQFCRPDFLPEATPPLTAFIESEISIEDVQLSIRKSRASSSPSPLDQIPYVIFKRCPSLHAALLDLFQECYRSHHVPQQWKIGAVKLIPKSTTSEDPSNPAKYRPITLTSCVSKLYTSIIKRRLESYLLENHFIDQQLQKAFLPGVHGCSEHQFKLWRGLQDAKGNQRSLCAAWIDLENAYGSVHHDIIQFAMTHYYVPVQCQAIVKDLYRNLAVFVQSSLWRTDIIRFQKGVFQGDPLSVIIFNMVINLYVDVITQPSHRSLAYEFSYANCSILLTQFADDTCLLANSVVSCQYLCRISDKFFQWAQMRVNVTKCRSLCISSRRRPRVFDPKLTIGDQNVPFIGSSIFNFLGLPFDINLSDSMVKTQVIERLEYLCQTVSSLMIRRQQKLKIYRLYVCPSMSWLLGLLDLPISWVERHVDSLVTRHLKQWSGLARAANASFLYMSRKDLGLALPKPSTSLKSLVSCKLRHLMNSEDSVVRQLADCECQYQLQLRNRKFIPAKFASSLSCEQIKQSIPQQVEFADNETLQRRVVQGSLVRADFSQQPVWAKSVDHLPDAVFKWSANSIVDTLPHNANLFRWKKSNTDRCPLCNNKQTLLHVLNNCPVALDQGRYTWRHDEVLTLLKDYLSQNLLFNFGFDCDLPHCSYNYLLRNFSSLLRPDICIFDHDKKKLLLLELTIPFDEYMAEAEVRKREKYRDLLTDIKVQGFDVTLTTVEVGSRGVISDSLLSFLQECTSIRKKQSLSLIEDVRRKVICCSYAVWCRRNSVAWS